MVTPRPQRGHYMALAWTMVYPRYRSPHFFQCCWFHTIHLDFPGGDGLLLSARSRYGVWFVQHGLPESPRWLDAHGRNREAAEVVAAIEQKIIAERCLDLPEIEPTDAPPLQKKGRWQEIFSARYLAAPLLIISLFQFCQTIGVFGFTAWVPILLAKQGITVVHSLQYTFMVYCSRRSVA